MRRRLLGFCLAMCMAVPQSSVLGQSQAPDPDLAIGIRQAQEGDFDAAVITLDAVVKRLSAQGRRPRELARAYTYLAIAYLGLSQEQTAKAKFLEALRADKDLDLSPKEFPPKILQFLEQAKREATGEAPRTAASPRPAAAPQKKEGGSKKGLVILGVVAAAGAGVAVAAGGGGRGSQNPSAAATPGARMTDNFAGTAPVGASAVGGHVIVVRAAGTLDATITWTGAGADVTMDLQERNPPFTTVANSTRSGNTMAQLSASVTPKEYQVFVSNFSQLNGGTYSLVVIHP